MNNKMIAEEPLTKTRSPQEIYDCAIKREKGVEHSKTITTNHSVQRLHSQNKNKSLWKSYNLVASDARTTKITMTGDKNTMTKLPKRKIQYPWTTQSQKNVTFEEDNSDKTS